MHPTSWKRFSATFALRGFRKPGTTSRSGDLARHAARSRLAPYERSRAAEWHTGGRKRRRPREWARVPRVKRVAVHWPRLHAETTFLLRVSPANLHRNKEPTSGLEPLTCSSRVSCSYCRSNPIRTSLPLGPCIEPLPTSALALFV